MCRTWQLLMRLATPRTLAISSRQGCWSKTQLLAKTKPRLIWAADSGNLGAVELLLSAGVDDTAKGFMVEALQKFEMVSKALIVCPQTWCPHVVFMAHGRCEGRVCCGPALTCMGSTSNIIIIPAKCNTLWFPRAAWGLALSCGIYGAGQAEAHVILSQTLLHFFLRIWQLSGKLPRSSLCSGFLGNSALSRACRRGDESILRLLFRGFIIGSPSSCCVFCASKSLSL